MTVYGDLAHVNINVTCPSGACWSIIYDWPFGPTDPLQTFDAGQSISITAEIHKQVRGPPPYFIGQEVSCIGQLCGLYVDQVRVATASTVDNGYGVAVVTFTFSIATAGAHHIVVSVEDVPCNVNGECTAAGNVPPCYAIFCGGGVCGPWHCTIPTV